MAVSLWVLGALESGLQDLLEPVHVQKIAKLRHPFRALKSSPSFCVVWDTSKDPGNAQTSLE